MDLEVYWLELAENKLKDIYDYYLITANKRVAKKLVNGIVEMTMGIGKFLEIGQVEIGLKHRKQEFKYLVSKNYKVIYWINHDLNRIEVANIFDTRQDPNKISETK